MFDDILVFKRTCENCTHFIKSTDLGNGVFTTPCCHKRGFAIPFTQEECKLWEKKSESLFTT
jgi:hypothetical protein